MRNSIVPPVATGTGALDDLCLYAGESVEYIKDVPAAGMLVERLWAEHLAA